MGLSLGFDGTFNIKSRLFIVLVLLAFGCYLLIVVLFPTLRSCLVKKYITSVIYQPLVTVLSVMPSGIDGIQLAWKPSLASGFRHLVRQVNRRAWLAAHTLQHLNNCLHARRNPPNVTGIGKVDYDARKVIAYLKTKRFCASNPPYDPSPSYLAISYVGCIPCT
jgi:hypothetical protein